MLQWKCSRIFMLLAIVGFPLFLLANDISQETKKAKLKELKKSIAALDARIQQQHQEKAQLQAALLEAQKTEKTLRAVLADTQKDVARAQRKQNNINTQIAKTRKTVLTQQQALTQEVRLMHKMGPIEQLKLWLNQTDPNAAYRMQQYFFYLYRAREQYMETIRADLTKLQSQERQLVAQTAELDALLTTQKQESALLKVNQQQQQNVLAALEADISTKTQTRDELLADQKALEALISQLATTSTAPPTGGTATGRFAQQRKSLIWPLQGAVLHRFGQARVAGLTWEGIFIQSAPEAPIKAVYPGQVIYADRLRGFGLLLIIDHGDNYMSLYGNNKSLYKKSGDFVKIGEQIAAAGAGGEHLPDSGLYFEIRLTGQPQDPAQWLMP